MMPVNIPCTVNNSVPATHLRIRRQMTPHPHALAPVDSIRAPLYARRWRRGRVRILAQRDAREALQEAGEHEGDFVVRKLRDTPPLARNTDIREEQAYLLP